MDTEEKLPEMARETSQRSIHPRLGINFNKTSSSPPLPKNPQSTSCPAHPPSCAPSMDLFELLPSYLFMDILTRLAASSKDPMEDLCSMRRTCKAMLQFFKSKDVARAINLPWMMESEVDKAHWNGDFRNTLFGSLAATDNTEACFRDGLQIVFGDNRSELSPPSKG